MLVILFLGLILGFLVVKIITGDNYGDILPHLLRGFLALFIGFFGFKLVGSGGVWKLAAVIVLWLPATLTLDTVLSVLTFGFVFGLLASAKLKIGQYALNHYAGIMCIIAAIIAFNGSVTNLI